MRNRGHFWTKKQKLGINIKETSHPKMQKKVMNHLVMNYLEITIIKYIEKQEADNELDSLISAFTSPVPSHILTDYDNKTKKKHAQHGEDQESALEH